MKNKCIDWTSCGIMITHGDTYRCSFIAQIGKSCVFDAHFLNYQPWWQESGHESDASEEDLVPEMLQEMVDAEECHDDDVPPACDSAEADEDMAPAVPEHDVKEVSADSRKAI